jgi:asparagine synthase (glutamine-hydrolysing)
MQFLDLLTYLPDDILAKVDRTSMAHALEVRVPLLDHRVVEAAWTLGPEAKLKGREGKQVLRAILDRYVPREIVDRPKMGFGVPLAHWLRYELRDWANDILGQADWENDFGLDGSVVRKAWAQHLAGQGNWAYRLWVLIMLAGWHQTWCARA